MTLRSLACLSLLLGSAGCDQSCAPPFPEVQPLLPGMRDDGAARLTVEGGTESNQNPCASPDGSFVVFTRFENGYNRGPAHIYLLDLDTPGAVPQPLTDGDYDDVNVPGGCFDRATGRVVFASDREGANDFWTVRPDPAAPELERLSSHGELPVWIEPVFSPDGATIAFELDQADSADEASQRAAVSLFEVATGDEIQLSNLDGTFDDRLPSWSPDGSTIVYQHRDPSAAESFDGWEAYLVPAAGGEPVSLTQRVEKRAPSPDTDLSWTPDGRWVLSSTNANGIEQPKIFMLPVEGGPVVQATFSEASEDGAPCASPDGTMLLFESHRTADQDSPSDLWVIGMPETSP